MKRVLLETPFLASQKWMRPSTDVIQRTVWQNQKALFFMKIISSFLMLVLLKELVS